MKNENKQDLPIPTEKEQAAINARYEKPEGLTLEESQRWDDIEHDESLFKIEDLFASDFRLFGKELFLGKSDYQ